MTVPAPSDAAEAANAWEHLRVRLCYWWRHGRWPDLAEPRRFTELIQVRKLLSRDPRMPALADKVAVKSHVAASLGPEWVTPTYWSGVDLPADAPWPRPFVLKSRHGCKQVRVVRPGDDWDTVRAEAARWAERPYGVWLDEWAYRHIPRGFLVEAFVGAGPALPVDYKLFVFGGRVEYVSVHSHRDLGCGDHRQIVLDRAWRRVSGPSDEPDPPRPASLASMVDGAEALGSRVDFVRVDLYEVDGRPRFGELTFYPGSGLDRFDPVSLDLEMGAHWLRARHLDFSAPIDHLSGRRGVHAA